MKEELNKLKSNLSFAKDDEVNTSIELIIIIIKMLDNKVFMGDQNTVTFAASFFCANLSLEGLKSKNISLLIQPLLAFLYGDSLLVKSKTSWILSLSTV